MAKLKGINFKQILILHAEKFVLGTVGLIVLFALMSTTWGGIQEQPAQLLDNAQKAGAALHTGGWPADEQAKFTDSTYLPLAQSMSAKLANEVGQVAAAYAYDKPMTFPLYKRIEPKTDPVFPPPKWMIADAGAMIIATNPPLPEDGEMLEGGADEEDGPRNGRLPRGPMGPMGPMGPASGAGGRAPTRGLAGGPMGPMGPMGIGAPPGSPASGGMPAGMGGMGAMGGGMGGASGVKPRGQRYVAVRGIIELDQYHRAIRDALRLDTMEEAKAMLEFMDVHVQRQRAVAGPEPWLDANWIDVDIAKADEVFAECELALDIVQLEVTDPVITMTLPARLDKDYDQIVSHPLLKNFVLSKEQREAQEKLTQELKNQAGAMGIGAEETPRRRGFSGLVDDTRGLQRNFMNQGGNMGEVYNKAGYGGGAGAGGRMGAGMMPQQTLLPATMMGGPSAGNMSGRGGRMGPGAGMAGMPGMPGMPGQMGAGMGQGQGQNQQIGAAAVGYVLLFRYLDFDVNPGEAYRYRVKLEVANPNFGEQLDRVREASVAEGETRKTDWSEPTAPVIVQTDANMFLTKVDERTRFLGEAEMKVFQWDHALGTYIDGDLRVKPGQFVGGLAESDRLDLATPSLEKKTVLFASKDFLLDTSIPTKLVPSEHPDLKLSGDNRFLTSAQALGAPGEALVMNQYGEVQLLDSESSRKDMAAANKRVQDERKPWESLRESATTETNRLDAAGAPNSAAMMQQMMMPTGVSSTKKRGANAGIGAYGADAEDSGAGGRRGGRGGRGGAMGRSSDAMGGGAGAGPMGTRRPGGK